MTHHKTASFRGIVSARAEGADPKAAIDTLNRAFEEFKAEHNRQLVDIRKGTEDVVRAEKVDRINAEITSLQAAVDETSRAVAAMRVGGGAPGQTAEQQAHAKAFDRFFRTGNAEALREFEAKAAVRTDSGPDGGYLVSEQVESQIDRVLGTVSAMRSVAGVMTISAGTYRKLVNQGGAAAGWVGEKDERKETDTPTLSELAFPAMEIYAEPAATQTLLDDARVDIGQWLADEVSISFAEAEGDAFINGAGVNSPRGLASYSMVADASYAWGKLGFVKSGVAADLYDGSHNGTDAVLNLIYALKQGYRNNARFLMNRSTQGALRKLVDDNGSYLWQPSLTAGQPALLAGYPITDDDNVEDIGANTFPVWFGDFRRGYLIVDRSGVRVLRDPYTNKPYVMFYTTKRVGGGVQNFEALKALKIAA